MRRRMSTFCFIASLCWFLILLVSFPVHGIPTTTKPSSNSNELSSSSLSSSSSLPPPVVLFDYPIGLVLQRHLEPEDVGKIKSLCRATRSFPCPAYGHLVFMQAVKRGNVDGLRKLLGHWSLSKPAIEDKITKSVYPFNDDDSMENLFACVNSLIQAEKESGSSSSSSEKRQLAHYLNDSDRGFLFKTVFNAVKSGSLETLQLLMSEIPSLSQYWLVALVLALGLDKANILVYLLSSFPQKVSDLLKLSDGHVSFLDVLLCFGISTGSDKSIGAFLDENLVNLPFDINAFGGKPIRLAISSGNVAILTRLLQHPEVNVRAQENAAARFAIRSGAVEALEVLLNDGRCLQAGEPDLNTLTMAAFHHRQYRILALLNSIGSTSTSSSRRGESRESRLSRLLPFSVINSMLKLFQ